MALLFGCQQQNPQKPDNLIPEDKMVQILADIHILEAQIETRIVYPDTALMVFNKEQLRLLEKHGVEEKDFRATYKFYLENIQQMDKLYDIILDTLSVREAKVRATDTLSTSPAPVTPNSSGEGELMMGH
ncbi:DUF4296 domain-containing protein [Pontibacter sp. JH31]|uniref:DUF4296 domain-containing protein n=1 Tax=Pontibacter aquaedesilientis TaxID=2766980 RepID=A0ABR7XDF5_9BACT|nr:DUF4296 domain-containing protein [Pontibacter aquaedesilientis]